MLNKIYVGTEGFLIKVDMAEDISAASAFTLRVKKPSGEETTWEPYVGASTKFYYYTSEADLDEVGVYVLQPYLTLGTWTGPGKPVRFTVVPAIL